MNAVYLKSFPPSPIDKREILRYAGVLHQDSRTQQLLEECLDQITQKLRYDVCFCEFDITVDGDTLDLGFIKANSLTVKKHLENCQSVIVFGATIGIEIDRYISRYSVCAPSKALMFQAIGAERIESLCDTFCDYISSEKNRLGFRTLTRFSPGYGDFPIQAQTEIFNVLDCHRKIGLSLNSSMIMSPSKSVTALAGISKKV